MPNVIDSLVVELGLDPAKYSVGVDAAQKRLEKFRTTVSQLAGDESKLDASQKKAFQALSDVASQAERTGKELQVSGARGGEFFDTLKTGAVGFGAALGIVGLEEFVKTTINSEAATGRFAASLGMSTPAVYAFGNAVEQAVGGSADAARATLAKLAHDAAALKQGVIPTDLLRSAAIMARYNGGAPVRVQDDAGNLLEPQTIVRNFGDPARRAGPQAAQAAMGGYFDYDTINFAGLGRAGMDAALNEQRRQGTPSDADARAAAELQKNTIALSQSFQQLARELVNDIAPALTAIMGFSKDVLQYATGHITGDELIKRSQDRDPDNSKTTYTEAEARARAEGIAGAMPLAYKSGEGPLGYARRIIHGADPAQQKARVDRLTALMMGGMTADQAKAQLDAEEAGAKPVPLNASPGTRAAAGMEQLLDAVRKVESGGRTGAISSAGAEGPYQLMPATARALGVGNSFDEQQSRAGARELLSQLLARYGGDRDKALAAYNWNPAGLDKDIARLGNNWRDGLPTETAAYLPRVQSALGDAGGNSTEINVAQVTVNTQAKDAKDIARHIRGALIAQSVSGAS